LVGGLLSWIKRCGLKLTDLDEREAERYPKHRAGKQCIQPGDLAALKRLLSVLREAGMIAPAPLPPITPEDQIFEGFSDHLRQERGLAPRSIIRHLPFVRRFLREVCPAGASDLGKISQEDVTRHVERHARDRSAASAYPLAGGEASRKVFPFFTRRSPAACFPRRPKYQCSAKSFASGLLACFVLIRSAGWPSRLWSRAAQATAVWPEENCSAANHTENFRWRGGRDQLWEAAFAALRGGRRRC
jgi:hypothetical protein